jgi:transposase
MANVLEEEKKKQVIALGRLGWSLRRIEEVTGVRRETVSAYLKATGVPVRRRGRRPRPNFKTGHFPGGVSTDPLPSEDAVSVADATAALIEAASPPALLEGYGAGSQPAATAVDSKPAISSEGVSTGSVAVVAVPPVPGRAPSASACAPFQEVIEEALQRGRNAMAIWQDLVDDHGFGARYSSVKRFVAALREATPSEARVVIETAPGDEAQVDYGGDGPMVRYPGTGKYRRARLFVMTLGYSRKCVRFLVWESSSQTWAELHERAFRRLGGVVSVVVLDNLGEGVIKPDIYDPTLNPLYRDVLAHYGAVALPCRVKDPDRKGKVESGVGHAQRTPLKGMRFESLDQAQAYLDRWEERWADTRIHGTTKRQVSAMFAEEKPSLRELPIEPFRYYRYGERTVHLDGCVEVEAAYYGAPPGWMGRKVHVHWDELHVRLLDPKTGQLLREHLRTRRGFHRIEERDRPSRTPSSTQALLRRAHSAGTNIGVLCEQIHRTDGPPGIRRVLGVLSLAKTHGPASVDDAAKAALECGAPTYRFVRTYLERRPPVPLTLRQVDPLIRQLTLYRDLIDQKAGEPT